MKQLIAYCGLDCESCDACTNGAKTVFCSDLCEIRKCVSEKEFNTCGNCK